MRGGKIERLRRDFLVEARQIGGDIEPAGEIVGGGKVRKDDFRDALVRAERLAPRQKESGLFGKRPARLVEEFGKFADRDHLFRRKPVGAEFPVETQLFGFSGQLFLERADCQSRRKDEEKVGKIEKPVVNGAERVIVKNPPDDPRKKRFVPIDKMRLHRILQHCRGEWAAGV